MSVKRIVTICNLKGLHARAAAKFVRCAENFSAHILVNKGDMEVGATSIMGLMMLTASKGSQLQLTGDGPDAEAALDALTDLVARRFDEAE